MIHTTFTTDWPLHCFSVRITGHESTETIWSVGGGSFAGSAGAIVRSGIVSSRIWHFEHLSLQSMATWSKPTGTSFQGRLLTRSDMTTLTLLSLQIVSMSSSWQWHVTQRHCLPQHRQVWRRRTRQRNIPTNVNNVTRMTIVSTNGTMTSLYEAPLEAAGTEIIRVRSNHQQLGCLFNSFPTLTENIYQRCALLALCEGNQRWTVVSHTKGQ